MIPFEQKEVKLRRLTRGGWGLKLFAVKLVIGILVFSAVTIKCKVTYTNLKFCLMLVWYIG